MYLPSVSSSFLDSGCLHYFRLLPFIKWFQLAIYNHFHNILRFFDVLPIFPFTTSETMHDYYLYTWYIHLLPNKLPKPSHAHTHTHTHKRPRTPGTPARSAPPKWKICQPQPAKNSRKIEIKPPPPNKSPRQSWQPHRPNPKLEQLSCKEAQKFATLDNCFSDLFTEVKISY